MNIKCFFVKNWGLVLIIVIVLGIMFLNWLIGNWKDAIDAVSKFGNLFFGIAALYGVNVFASERRKKRSDAAAFIWGKIDEAVAEILRIADERGSYQYISYPEKFISEGTQDEQDRYPERPARMIEAISKKLEIDLYKTSALLPLQAMEGIQTIIVELQKESKNLAIAIYESLKDPKYANTIESNRSTLTNYSAKLQRLEEQAKSLLAPIIERGE